MHAFTQRSRQELSAVGRKRKRSEDGDSGLARSCFRCHKRSNNCRSRRCLPYKWEPNPARYTALVAMMRDFARIGDGRRRIGDNDDNQVICRHVGRICESAGVAISLLAIIVFRMFQSLKSWSVLQSAFDKNFRWKTLERRIAEVKDKFGWTMFGHTGSMHPTFRKARPMRAWIARMHSCYACSLAKSGPVTRWRSSFISCCRHATKCHNEVMTR